MNIRHFNNRSRHYFRLRFLKILKARLFNKNRFFIRVGLFANLPQGVLCARGGEPVPSPPP